MARKSARSRRSFTEAVAVDAPACYAAAYRELWRIDLRLRTLSAPGDGTQLPSPTDASGQRRDGPVSEDSLGHGVTATPGVVDHSAAAAAKLDNAATSDGIEPELSHSHVLQAIEQLVRYPERASTALRRADVVCEYDYDSALGHPVGDDESADAARVARASAAAVPGTDTAAAHAAGRATTTATAAEDAEQRARAAFESAGIPLCSAFSRRGAPPASAVSSLPAAGSASTPETIVAGQGWRPLRYIRRKLVPRNPNRDPSMEQDCLTFVRRRLPQVHESDSMTTATPHEGRSHGPRAHGLPTDPVPRTELQPTTEHGHDQQIDDVAPCDGERGHTEVLALWRVDDADLGKVPFYHPQVAALALHFSGGSISIAYLPLPPLSSASLATSPAATAATAADASDAPAVQQGDALAVPADDGAAVDARTRRTLLQLLSLALRYARGVRDLYVKRVRHDVVVARVVFETAFQQLKDRYAAHYCSRWRESTDPGKHVFEDLAIAAWLLGVWAQSDPARSMAVVGEAANGVGGSTTDGAEQPAELQVDALAGRSHWPRFVDVGCGNGLLVDLLLRLGATGYGFDLRARKSWSDDRLFCDATRGGGLLRTAVLLPGFLSADFAPGEPATEAVDHPLIDNAVPAAVAGLAATPACSEATAGTGGTTDAREATDTTNAIGTTESLPLHDGAFAADEFLIGNHADELTPWLPLLAALSSTSPTTTIVHPASSISISPSASTSASASTANATAYTCDDYEAVDGGFVIIACCPQAFDGSRDDAKLKLLRRGARTADVAGAEAARSAGAGPDAGPDAGGSGTPTGEPLLTSKYGRYVAWLAEICADVGWEVEREYLRIPSTRNIALLGRRRRRVELAGLAAPVPAAEAHKRLVDLCRRIVAERGGAEGVLEHARRLAASKGSPAH